MMLDRATSVAQSRRPPAHLSVSFRPGRSGPDVEDSVEKTQVTQQKAKEASLVRGSSGESNESGVSGTALAKKWFDRSNARPGGKLGGQMIVDNDPPFFLRTYSSSSSNYIEALDPRPAVPEHPVFQYGPGPIRAATNRSSVDDFRSVIDDLTVENKRLKERLRKYETTHSTHLDKDKLFEVRVHALPAQKKRELEETLRAFASSISIDRSSAPFNSQLHLGVTGRPDESPSTHPSSTSTSNSRPVDSAYVSMSTSGTASWSASNRVVLDRKRGAPPAKSRVESLLQDTPPGLLPRHPAVMTERMKKKLVVQRLEQLFTGKTSASGGEHSQPLQQGVPNSAARDEYQVKQKNGQHISEEGVREAQILTPDKYMGKYFSPQSHGHSIVESSSTGQAEGRISASTPDSSEQRPTRPLDLDPDRAQIPSDNIEYIRHLGFSTPNMATDSSGDATDADGWVYLNLLVNMAQLHIINVTPDFVRSAVAEVSEKFQLSSDGRKVRWRGDCEGTKFSSDSGVESALHASPNDSDSLDESSGKRRKPHISLRENMAIEHTLKLGQFSSAPHSSTTRNKYSHIAKRHHAFYYKPMFRHSQRSQDDSMFLDESGSQASDVGVEESGTGHVSNPRRGRSASSSQKRRDDGAIVFYNGAPFYTDLSGDYENIATPLNAADVGKDGYSNRTDDAVGCIPKKLPPAVLSRTPSGSELPFRPFKDYSICAQVQETQNRTRSPKLLSLETSSYLDFSPEWVRNGSNKDPSLQKFDACGLGGTRPADHFAVTVETRRTKLDSGSRAKLSEVSPQLWTPEHLRSVSKPLRDLAQTPGSQDFADSLTSRLAAMKAHSPASSQLSEPPLELPVKTEILSTHVHYLRPSDLPLPVTYHAPYSSSDDEYSEDSTSDGTRDRVNGLRQSRPFAYRAFSPVLIDDNPMSDNESDTDDEAGNSSDNDNSSSSAF